METKINLNFSWTGMLGLVFIVLKLCGIISWSWLWVLSPIWISAIIAIIALAIFLIKIR